jgi:hypothetical protein
MKNVGVPILGRGLKRKERIEFHLSDEEEEENTKKKIKIQ